MSAKDGRSTSSNEKRATGSPHKQDKNGMNYFAKGLKQHGHGHLLPSLFVGLVMENDATASHYGNLPV